jgi:glutamyl-Q tRNA(Asp) synthetase
MEPPAESRYVGRFAPSPTGPLHAGSLVAALASWLDARAHGGQWLVRIEDVDTARTVPGADHQILQQLAACGLHPDAPPVWQSQRSRLYQAALQQLIGLGHAYGCTCSRKDIEHTRATQGQTRSRHTELVYPGTCRNTSHRNNEGPLAWRLRTDIGALAPGPIAWTDRQLGRQHQDVERQVGDFVLQRADGCATYQLAVVVDDAAQGVTHVVRGHDLADNTARQVWLQACLGLPTPQYWHTPLVLGSNGEKLSKQNHAQALDPAHALADLNQAAAVLGLAHQHSSIPQALAAWTQAARAQWP